MVQKFHKYNFCANKMNENLQKQFNKIKVLAKRDEDEIYLYSVNGSGSHSVYLQDRFFNFNVDDETKNICAFEGDVNESKLIIANLEIPQKINNAVLRINTKENLEAGCGSYVKFASDKLFYDKEHELLQLGLINLEAEVVKFFENGYAQIKDHNLTGLIFSEIKI